MLITQEPIFRQFWYATLRLDQLDDGPQAFTLLGEDIVLWKRQDGTPAALEDKCPHRSVKLSVDSLIVDDTLRCGYHGWRFDGAGTCVLVPQAPATTPPGRNAVKSYHCTERYGYVWVCLEEPVRDIPYLPHSDDPAFRQIFEYDQHWSTNALRVAENALDLAHVSFVHRVTFGEDDNPVAPKLEMFDVEDGIGIDCEYDVANRDDQQKNLNIADDHTHRVMRIQWLMPTVFTLSIKYPNGLIHQICGFATPIDDRNTHRCQFVFRNDTEADAPAADVAAFDRRVASEDRRILESCGPDYPLDLHEEAHMWMDRPGIEMRKMLSEWLSGPPETRAPAPRAYETAAE
jgi:phenylpropionate dioxygenase-like ring-hydroxylating dioxygenase large terminal subunit